MTRFQFPIQEIANEMEQFVDRMFPKGTSGETTAHGTPTYTPAMDVAESESRYVVSLDLPGVKIEDIKIEIHEDRLTVSGTRSAIERNHGTQYHREERSFGEFRRALVLPKSVDSEKIEASYNAGVMEIVIPKLAKAQPRTIEVRTNG